MRQRVGAAGQGRNAGSERRSRLGQTRSPGPAARLCGRCRPGPGSDRWVDAGGARSPGSTCWRSAVRRAQPGWLGPWILDRMSSGCSRRRPRTARYSCARFAGGRTRSGTVSIRCSTTAAWSPAGINLAWVISAPALALAMATVTGRSVPSSRPTRFSSRLLPWRLDRAPALPEDHRVVRGVLMGVFASGSPRS